MAIDWDAFTNHTLTTAEVRLLGAVDLPSVLALQKLIVHEVRCQSRTNAAILICEHPPTVSVGSGATLLELPESSRELESRLIAVHKLRRDGHAILHQPGQLAAYVVVALPECSMDEAEFRTSLQQAVIEKIRDQDAFNWCYDPLHYMAPEGSYSSNANDISRIRRTAKPLNR